MRAGEASPFLEQVPPPWVPFPGAERWISARRGRPVTTVGPGVDPLPPHGMPRRADRYPESSRRPRGSERVIGVAPAMEQVLTYQDQQVAYWHPSMTMPLLRSHDSERAAGSMHFSDVEA